MKTQHLILSILAMAPVSAIATTQYAGFISQSIVKTSDGVKLSGSSDAKLGSIKRSELGGAVSHEVNDNIDIRAMGSIIVDGDIDSKPRINYALADIHASNGLYGVRVGRYSYDYGFYNAGRNSPSYRDMELPPQGLYRDGFKYMTRSGDGVQAYHKTHINPNYSLEVDASIGQPVLFPQRDIVQTFVLDPNAGQFSKSSKTISFNAQFDARAEGIVVKYGYLQMDYRFETPYIDNSTAFSMRSQSHYIGIRKYMEVGDITLEYMSTQMGTTKWDTLLPLPGYDWGGVMGYSITYKHYITPMVSGIIGYDAWYVNKNDMHGKELESQSGSTTGGSRMYHESINIGVNHRFKQYTFKVELHHVRGTNAVRAENEFRYTPSVYNIAIATITYKF